ncbi:phospho-acceptor domain-containing protein [Litoreibacter ponti]|uniref:histidine kinase n=1 Tax=Litoreibacter ponti TaxID=1510457 RepID=A0A2T6BNG3_9RHOB|nr:CHASE domain-containing protein [Litoreibacter ponti]PTX57611.1 phospho-acceptor domain-containing protein [Litoreibacter ponti]
MHVGESFRSGRNWLSDFIPATGMKGVHWVVVLLSLVMTLIAWQIAEQQVEKQIRQRFESSLDRTVGLIEDRMNKYEDALWAGVSAVESHGGDMTLKQWRIFSQNLRIEERYPGINGIGVIHFLDGANDQEYLRTRRAERADFVIHPQHDQAVSMPISFIEPQASNAAAVGLDVAHEENRRTAALASRDTGKAQITGPIVLVQDEGATPGFLFYAPFFAGGPQPDVTSRRENFLGAVYAPFVVRKLLDGLLSQELRQINLSISDDGETIYDEHLADDPLYDPDPLFTREIKLPLYGREWQLDVRTNLAFRQGNSVSQPILILIGGLIIEALLISIFLMLSRAHKSAIKYADRVTEELRQKTETLERTNSELQQFAYAASHDLKTPIRGIGGLTGLLREDLKEYMSSKDANPDVAMGLELIEERVRRMQNLTSGILEFSRSGCAQADEPPLDLRKFVTDLRSDLDLPSDALDLNGSVDQISVAPSSCRRVLENLVTNAIKHHDNKRPIKVILTATESGDWMEIAVSDNGPGIDEAYHAKVFEMFQTLRMSSAAESTGLGLAIVKKAVVQNGGHVWVESEPGKGATFRFLWPIETSSPNELPCEQAA